MSTKFKVGDKVRWAGVEGLVTKVYGPGYTWPVVVSFFDGEEATSFTPDGKYNPWHKVPSLELIERPKKKHVVTMYPALCNSWGEFFVSDSIYESNESAKDAYPDSFLRLMTEMPIEVEVEDEA